MAFIYGCIGLAVAIAMMNFIMIEDWPQTLAENLVFRIWKTCPPLFLLVRNDRIFAAHLMVITFYMRSKLWPFKKAENPNPLTTDDKFLVEIELHDNEKELKACSKSLERSISQL